MTPLAGRVGPRPLASSPELRGTGMATRSWPDKLRSGVMIFDPNFNLHGVRTPENQAREPGHSSVVVFDDGARIYVTQGTGAA